MNTTVALVAVADRPLAGCIAYLRSPSLPGGFLFGITNGDGYAAFNGVPVPFTGVLQLAGACQYYEQLVSISGVNVTIRVGPSASNPQDVQLPACASFRRPSRPIAVPRGSLPPMPLGTFDRVLPWEPPASRDFLRADCWGVPVDGLPFVNRGSSEHPERFLTYFDYKYSRANLQAGLDLHAERGYTHWIRSWPDARDDGGCSISQFVDDCLFIKRTIPYVHVKLASKDFDPRDQTKRQWLDRVLPVMGALMAAHAVDEFGVWEWDAFNVPGLPTIQTFKEFGSLAHDSGCSFWAHFYPEHTSWFADGDNRGRYGFWADLGADVDGLDFQTQPTWTIQETQARLVDTLTQFGSQPYGHKLRFFEDQAALQFTHDHPDEDDANLRGYLACCTVGKSFVFGYGNGARRLDGRPL